MMMNNRPGDWNCRSCFHLNFQRRESCQRCGDPKPVAVDHYGGSSGFGLRVAAPSAAAGGGSNSSFGLGLGGGFTIGPDVRPGDWYCTVNNCGAHNFASRSSCFKCGAFKLEALLDYNSPVSAASFDHDHMSRAGRISPFSPTAFSAFSSAATTTGNTSRSGWKSGDWICTRSGCNEHNFASRMECFRCNAPRVDSSTMTSSYY